MEKVITDKQKIKALVDYYKKDGLSIIGLNDSQGVNTTSTFFKKGLLEYLANALTTKELSPTVINAFSLLMNKTEHIDYFLENNLSLEEIKLSQTYSAVAAMEKVMEDINLPHFLGKLGYIYKLVHMPKKNDKNIHISTVLKESKEPTVIYSSGVNNLMREVGNNPFAIKKDYIDRFERPNYDYTFERAKDHETLYKVTSGIERNFERILSINSNADIYALGAYVPKSLEKEDMNIFRELVLSYNGVLERLCRNYHVTYINTEAIGKSFNSGDVNFHISKEGHNKLANHILEYMYENKIVNPSSKDNYSGRYYYVSNDGSKGVLESINYDYDKGLLESAYLMEYDRKRELEISKEHKREAKVFTKVLNKIEKK